MTTPCRARGRQPLILADAAVIVGLGLGHAGLFNERALLEVQTRGVRVGRDERQAFFQRFGAAPGREQGLAAQGTQHALLAEILAVTGLAEALARIIHGFALGLAAGQKVDVTGGQGFHAFALFGIGVGFPGALRFVGKCFFHDYIPCRL